MEKLICKNPWTHFEINNPNGNVNVCCIKATARVLGNVRQQSIWEIWNGKEFQKLRREMLNFGADKVCFPNCPYLSGFRSYENLDWYKNCDPGSAMYKNAELNEQEISDSKTVLLSRPRWFKFAYSYDCNLDCYHCYEMKDRKKGRSLPTKFLKDFLSYGDSCQKIFYFGGEPFLFPQTLEVLTSDLINPDCRHCFFTNGNLLNEKVFQALQRNNIGFITVSVDAAREQTYKILRRGGDWQRLTENLLYLKEMRRNKRFVLAMDMTLNSKNFEEIEAFVDWGIELDAQPYIFLVVNSLNSYSFQKEYLCFSDSAKKKMIEQIDRSIKKIKDKNFPDSLFLLNLTKQNILSLDKIKINPVQFFIFKNVYNFYKYLPQPVKNQVNLMFKSTQVLRS